MTKQRLTAIVAEIQQNVKERKQDEGLRFTYNGVEYDLSDRTQRIALIDRITYDYVDERDPALLERLTDAILDEELTDMHPDKVTNTEYPFMSEWQLDLRRDRETGLKAVEETGTDGRDYRRPTKRRRTNYENWHVDKHAHGRNKARAEQYRKDTAAGPVLNVRSTEFVSAATVAQTWRERLSLVH
ncbi:hypothetical protein [Paenibacillus sp. NPDC057967]|uniref:hypothetical protein n=1 Tax=Paenibacillus sp. NPDC057967 TaxID=3346293 RepID=UPI0036DEE44B